MPIASCSLTLFEPHGYEWQHVGDFSFGVGAFQSIEEKRFDTSLESTSVTPRGMLDGIACHIPRNREHYGEINCDATAFEDLNQDNKVQLEEILAWRRTRFGLENSSVHFPRIRLKRYPQELTVIFELTSDLGTIRHVQQAP